MVVKRIADLTRSYFCTVIKAHNRLRTGSQTGYRHGDNLSDGIDDSHNSDVDISAIMLKGRIADNLTEPLVIDMTNPDIPNAEISRISGDCSLSCFLDNGIISFFIN